MLRPDHAAEGLNFCSEEAHTTFLGCLAERRPGVKAWDTAHNLLLSQACAATSSGTFATTGNWPPPSSPTSSTTEVRRVDLAQVIDSSRRLAGDTAAHSRWDRRPRRALPPIRPVGATPPRIRLTARSHPRLASLSHGVGILAGASAAWEGHVGKDTVDWRALESELRDRLRGRRLVIEIGLTAQLQKEVEAALSRVVTTDSTPRDVVRRAPALLAVCLVAHGVYRYRQGNYWDGFPLQSIDVSYGPAFETALQLLDLEMFTEMVEQENAQRYVARILAHGGIPKWSLGDFFGLLQRGLRDGAQDATDMVVLWRSRRAAFAGVDQPVRRFLMYGKSIARDYLDRSIDLYREWGASGTFPSPETAGLPVSVITELRRLSELGDVEQPRAGGPRRHGARPTLVCDPWDPLGPTLTLPARADVSTTAVWTIGHDRGLVRERASTTTPKSVPIDPARRWDVTLTDGGRTILRTAFEGLDEIPALFFSPQSGSLLAPGLGLPAEEVWVLRPADKELSVVSSDGEPSSPRVIATLPEPTGEWSGFTFEHVDLAGWSSLSIGSGSNQRSIALRSTARPSLGGTFLPTTNVVNGLPVCTGEPTLETPEGVREWRVTVTVGDATHHMEVPSAATVRLDRFLPADHAVEVTLSARGALGSDLRERFAWVPGLSVSAPDRLSLPHDPPPIVHVTSPCVAFVGGDGVERTLQPEPGGDAVEVLLTSPGEPALLNVSVPVLRWGLLDGARWELGTSIVALHDTDLLDGAPPALAVSTGCPGTRLRLALESNGEQVQAWKALEASGPRGQFRYDLSRITDAVRVLDAPAALILYVGDAGIPVRVASITPELEFTDLEVGGVLGDGEALVSLSFRGARHARGRVLRLWPRHRLWDPPISTPVPDDAQDEAVLVVHPPPEPGDYLAELTIDDGFSAPVRPSAAAASVTKLQLGDAQEIQRDMAARAEGDPTAVVELALARGQRARELQPTEHFAAAVTALASWLLTSRLPQLTAHEQRGCDALLGILRATSGAIAPALEELTDDDLVAADDGLLRLAILLAPDLPREGGMALDSTWRLEPALASLLDLGLDAAQGGDASAEYLGWTPADGVESIDEADDTGRITQQWLGLDIQTLEAIRLILQFDVRPRPLSQDGRIAATFEWLRSNAADEGRTVRQWRSAYHRLTDRPIPSSAAIRRHLDARRPAPGAAAWGDFGRLTLVAALHLCGATSQVPTAQRALLEAIRFAPQQVRRDVILAWVLTNDLLREHALDDLPTEQLP